MASEKKVKVIVRTDGLHRGGKFYPYGAEMSLPEGEAELLLRRGDVEAKG